MKSETDLEIEAMKLPDAARAGLAARLLDSLPPLLEDSDEGVAEALNRDAELDQNPGAGMSLEQIKDAIRRK